MKPAFGSLSFAQGSGMGSGEEQVQKEWLELSDRWKKHLIRECVRHAIVSRARASPWKSYEDVQHGLVAQRMPSGTDQWLVMTPDKELWCAQLTNSGKLRITSFEFE